MLSDEERYEITREMERLFYHSRDGLEPEDWCIGRCPHAELCEREKIFYSCGVWEESMGEDL